MKRREFITLVGAVAAFPVAARAQAPPTKVFRRLYLVVDPGSSVRPTGVLWTALEAELGRLGYAEGRT